ncbi:hypothetical protein CcCBS67573_g01108 [Chytriomyces confervae]|uniref:SH3 domain-containing protein n=1 Tax=Chytriomyces confervae TaxID=246404 RepID=A0A507FMT0_9FUNG|nr:hypothetical protein CcCBS67573_g01108 [Chytriomyces confervae]
MRAALLACAAASVLAAPIATTATTTTTAIAGVSDVHPGRPDPGAVAEVLEGLQFVLEPPNQNDPPEVVTPVEKYSFFTVAPANQKGNACQGFLGLLTLYQGGSFEVKWPPTFFAASKYAPTSMDLFLVSNNANASPEPYYLVKNRTIDPKSTYVNVSLPLDAPKNGSYTLTGTFFDAASGKVVTFRDKDLPENRNVAVVPQGADCDLQTPQSTPINVALAAGLGGGISGFLLIFTAVTVYRSRLLIRRERKGKYWVDGPNSKYLQKENFFDATLSKIRNFFVRRQAAKRKAAGQDGDDESSDSEDEQSTTEGDSYAMDTLSNATNPFLSDEENNKISSSTYDSVVPLKDDSSSTEEAKKKRKAKGKQAATKKSESGLSSRFGYSKKNAVHAEKDEQSKGSEKSSLPAALQNSSVVRDPITGQVRTFVFLDNRGPPVRNGGGSSSWSPPEHALHVRHRVLTAYSASHPDELTVMRSNLVVVETVLEDGWAVVYKIDDPNAPKAEAVNKGKKGEIKLVGKMPSAPLMSTSPDAVSWGKRVLGLGKDPAVEDLGPLGDAATGGKRGLVPYNILFMWPEPFGARKPGGAY